MALTLLRHPAQKPPIGPLKLDLGNPLTWGLQFAVPLTDYGSATAQDFSQNLYRGTLIKGTGAGNLPAWSSGQMGPQLSFVSSDNTESVDFGAAKALQTTAALSIVAWIVDTQTAQARDILGWNAANSTDATGQFVFRIDGSAGNVLSLNKAGVNQLFGDTGAVPASVLTQVACTYDGATVSFYINGAPTTSGISSVLTFAYANTSTLRIGMEFFGTPYNGSIATVYAWNRRISAADVASLYAEPFQMFQTRPLQRWFVVAVQIARPSADVSVGGWTTDQDLTTNEYSRVNEAVRDDTTYVQSSLTPSANAVTFALGTLLTPLPGTQTLKYRYGKDQAGMQVNLQVDLLQGGVVVQTWTHTNIPTAFTEADQTVTGVTNFNLPLSIRFTATQP